MDAAAANVAATDAPAVDTPVAAQSINTADADLDTSGDVGGDQTVHRTSTPVREVADAKSEHAPAPISIPEPEPVMLTTPHVTSITTSQTGDFRGLVVNVASGAPTDTFRVLLPNISQQLNMVAIKTTNTPSEYIVQLRAVLQRFANLIITGKLATLTRDWNMAVRDGLKFVELFRAASGYFDSAGIHSFEEGGMVSGVNRYPIDLLLFGIDKYLEMNPIDETKDAATVSAKKIEVNVAEIRRFNFVNVIEIVQAGLREMLKDPTLTVTADFTKVYDDDGRGVAIGTWSVKVNWTW